jgi:hypothetical protein
MNIKSIRPIIIDTRTDKIKSNIKILENTLDILNNIPTIDISRPILYTSRELYHKDIDYYKINELKSLNEYSKFCIKFGNIWPDDAYALFCQHDGYPININCWDDRFLDYDYIGAPWPNKEFKNRVGNGGFSLRSKKFLEVCTDLFKDYPDIVIRYNHPDYLNEDFLACNVYYDEMMERGIKFADVETASKFSIEHPILEMKNQTFGFHGNFIRR